MSQARPMQAEGGRPTPKRTAAMAAAVPAAAATTSTEMVQTEFRGACPPPSSALRMPTASHPAAMDGRTAHHPRLEQP